MRIVFFLFLLGANVHAFAQRIFGTVYNDKGDLLPFSSITVKGTSAGTSANNNAKFSFSIQEGKYSIVCQHIGYAASEKTLEVHGETEITFVLSEQKLLLKEVIIKNNQEDPAYEIIRKAIKKRAFYHSQVDAFTCNMYGKDLVKLRSLPLKVFGKKIDQDDRKDMGVDSNGKGIIYLSESISKISSRRPDKFKLEVASSRVSGSNSFGFTFPAFISLYTNNVTIFTGKFNPRGFVSPVADGALNFYRYKFLGSFVENGKLVNTIRVIPRRNYEPVFSGIINITEDDWRIHSFDLILTKKSQLEIMDTLQITQLHVPVSADTWRVKNQLLHFNFDMFKVDMVGNFLTVYSDYNLDPVFDKNFFNNIVIKYDTAVSKKSKNYWDSIRPVPLEYDEVKDYRVKDSTFLAQADSLKSRSNMDTLKKRQGRVKPLQVFWTGIHRTHYGKGKIYNWGIESLIQGLEYNPAEGLVVNADGYVDRFLRKTKSNIVITPNLRYGFSNTHFNGWLDLVFRERDFPAAKKIRRQSWAFSGGKRVTQFNKENPISPFRNSITTLFYGNNYMKTYENYFGSGTFTRRYESGLRLSINALYEDRLPLNNTTKYTFSKGDSINITPNFPGDRKQDTMQFLRHQAVIVSFDISFKPGQKYIQLPYQKISLGSKYPTFTLSYSKGINGIFGSDVNFDKWKLTVHDDKNFKLAGTFKYKLGIGGFLNTKKVFIQDYQHFNGGQRLAASPYVNSFQLAKYYAHSTIAAFYSTGNIEHHFNGLLTNKIPLFKRLNWNLIAGANAFFVDRDNNYNELFFGLENIFKIFRVDFVAGYENGRKGVSGLKVGFGGLIGESIMANFSGGRKRSVSIAL